MRRFEHLSAALAALALAFTAWTAPGDPAPDTKAKAEEPAAPAEPRAATPADYGKFERLTQTAIAPDGRWFAYGVSRIDEESELRLHHLATDDEKVVEYGSSPGFSKDASWFAYRIGVSPAEREKLQKQNKPVKTKLGLRNLVTGDTDEIDDINSYVFSDDGKWLIMRRGGGTMILRNLATGVDTTFGHVGAYSWADDNALLAMTISAPDKIGNGVALFNPATGVLRTLDSDHADYKGLSWREDADDLAVMREIAYEDDEDVSHAVLAWPGLLDDTDPEPIVFDPTEHEFPDDSRIVDYAGLRWSDDGDTLFFGAKAWENEPKAVKEAREKTAEDDATPEANDESEDGDADDEEGEEKPEAGNQRGGDKKPEKKKETLRDSLKKDPSNVEVWHADDIDIQPRQKRVAGQERRRNYLAAWSLDEDSVVMLGSDLTERTILMDQQTHAIGLDNTPHERLKMFGPTLYDVYVIDVATGERTQILSELKYPRGSSPDGKLFMYQKDDHAWVYDVAAAEHRNLTENIDAEFVNTEISTLTDEKPVYGAGGWLEDGSAVLLYDKFDIWHVPTNGDEAKRLTNGAKDQIRHRRVVIDREDDEFVPADHPMYVSMYGEMTKKSGYARLSLDSRPRTLIYEDALIARLDKAKDTDVYMYRREAFDEPTHLVVTGPKLEAERAVARTNQFLEDEFLWGKATLIDYENVHGEPLQGALHYPADYTPGEQYPMIVYIYEKRSQNLHRFTTPSERSAYNPAVWTSQGYFVYQPDIVYRPQNPGLSAVECLVPAVEAALATGLIDEDRVGLCGHSWGAYQTAFVVTQTDMFAAGIAGAPLTNMMSMSMSIYWNSGQTDAWIFHESQGRMDKPFWNDVDTYIANSPIFHIEEMNTPLMIAFGDEDGAVDFNQGVEMYNAARLADKDFVMLVYPGENHGLRDKSNQIDYHYRILEWFDHYLRGADPEPWITEGKSFLDRERELEKNKAGGGSRGGRRR